MKFRQQGKSDLDVNLTPLIDVVFLLLIFFMVTTTFDRNAEIKIQLPKASETQMSSSDRNHLELLIDSKGRYYVNGRELLNTQPETLFRAMNIVLNEMEVVPTLLISADANSNYQSVVTAMDIAGRLGLSNFSIATTNNK